MVVEQNIEYLDGTDKRILGSKAYYVRIRRNNVEHSRMFLLSNYSSEETALRCAQKFKEDILNEHGRINVNRKENKFLNRNSFSTGVVGVNRTESMTRNPLFRGVCYSVHFKLSEHNTLQNKSFYIGRVYAKTLTPVSYSTKIELKAFRLAVYTREFYNLCMDNNIPFDGRNINSTDWKEREYEEIIRNFYI